jgi:hypothetical protein
VRGAIQTKECLLGRHAAWADRIDAAIAAEVDPKARILAIFDVLGELFAEPDYRGCSFTNAIAEASEGGPEFAAAQMDASPTAAQTAKALAAMVLEVAGR